MHDPEDELFDRRGLSDLSALLFGERGRIPKSRIDKMALLGLGPAVDAMLGPKELTTRRNAVPYLRSLLSPTEAKSRPSLTAMLRAHQEQRRAERKKAAP
jgi:hypothetical protein